MHHKNTGSAWLKFRPLVISAFILLMALLSLLPVRGKTYNHYSPEEGLEFTGKLALPEKTGEGEIRRKDGLQFKGQLLESHLEGQGQVLLAPDLLFEGKFDQGNVTSGKMTIKDEASYLLQEDGSWSKEKKEKK